MKRAPKAPSVRLRMPPSPTGYLHIGTARTALFNRLFADKKGGIVVLRSEDTDKTRSKPEYEADIIENLNWLGLGGDEGLVGVGKEKGKFGPYRQSERIDVYKKYLQQLLDERKAYYCFCSKEELEGERQSQKSAGQPARYSGTCRSLSAEEVERRINDKKSSVIRLKVPAEKIKFFDHIRGALEFNNELLGDIVIAKSLSEPLYNFAVVIDDYTMQITHVIRGEDHLSNTSKQIALQHALGLPAVEYAHLPLILNPDRSKMSKRHGNTNVKEYRAQGYLPEAMVNFLLLLGWHPADDQEIFTREEMTQKFDLSRIQKSGAIFNLEKLNWLNAHYLRQLATGDLIAKLQDFGAIPKKHNLTKTQLKQVVELCKERMKILKDFSDYAGFFFELPAYEPKLLVWKNSTSQKAVENLEILQVALQKISPQDFVKVKLDGVIFPIADKLGRGDVLWPLRVALSGSVASPGPVEILEILGKKAALDRVKIALEKLAVQPALY